MTEPKRAEPNEHAQRLRNAARAYAPLLREHCESAAAEIERLQNRIWEIQYYPEILQEAKLRAGYAPTNPPKILGYDVLVDGKPVAVLRPEAVSAELERLAARVREWLPIADAPRDGTRVELWCERTEDIETQTVARFPAYGQYEVVEGDGIWLCNRGYPLYPTHWRSEPAGPSASPPLPSG